MLSAVLGKGRRGREEIGERDKEEITEGRGEMRKRDIAQSLCRVEVREKRGEREYRREEREEGRECSVPC